MLDKPQIVKTTAQAIAVIRLTVPREEIQKVMGPGHRELMAAVAAQGVATTGPWLTHRACSKRPAVWEGFRNPCPPEVMREFLRRTRE